MTKKTHLLTLSLVVTLLATTVPAQVRPYAKRQIETKFETLYHTLHAQELADATAMLQELRQDERFTAEAQYTLTLIATGLEAAAAKKSTPALPKAPEGLTPTEIEAAHFNAAKAFVALRNHELARHFGAVEQKEVPRYPVMIVPEAPSGAAAWHTSQLTKNARQREARFEKYNQKAAALLINDVNAIRAVSEATTAESGVSFFVAADKRGLHIYLELEDDAIDEVLAGLKSGGSLEMSLQPGAGNFYYQWMANVPSGKVNCYNWMSPHTHYRLLADYISCNVAPISNGFGVALTISWSALYDYLPAESDEWALGVIPWTRRGGFTWGSGQVHELNRFGRITFKGIDAIMPQIKRQLVLQAWGSYRKSSPDIKTFWNDEQRGDRSFEAEVLKPLVEQLEKWGTEVAGDMNDATVNRLFKEAVPLWNEFPFEVSARRSAYLRHSLLAE